MGATTKLDLVAEWARIKPLPEPELAQAIADLAQGEGVTPRRMWLELLSTEGWVTVPPRDAVIREARPVPLIGDGPTAAEQVIMDRR